MKYGVMEGFLMHHSETEYGLKRGGGRASLFPVAGKLGFHGVELGVGLDHREDPPLGGRRRGAASNQG